MGSDLWLCETEGGEGCVLCQRLRILVTPRRQRHGCEVGVGLDP